MHLLRRALALVALCLFASPAYGQARYQDVPIYALDYGGVERHFGLYVPASYARERPAALIIALHGRMSSAKAFHAQSGLGAVAEAQGAIVVYPEPHGQFWNDGGQDMRRRGGDVHEADDAGFLRALVDELARGYAIDRTRVFAAGHDQGGSMAYRLACAGALPLAGVAAVNAAMPAFVTEGCQAQPLNVLIMQGGRDQYAAIDAEHVAGSRDVDAIVAFWRGVNGCASAPAERGRAGSAVYACRDGAQLAYVGVGQGGHDWFRVRDGAVLNRHNVDAAALLGQFFFARGLTFPNERSAGLRPMPATVYVPPTYDAGRPMPAVMVLHGRPGTGLGMASLTQMNEVADRNGFIVIYPDGPNNEWHSAALMEGERGADRRDAGPSARDDVRELEQLLDDLRLDLNIDPSRIYLTGFSNGAIMTARMACTSADRFAAFAVVGGAFYDVFREECDGSRPTPILFMHGTADRSVRYNGVLRPIGPDATRVQIAHSIPDAVQYFARHNGCSSEGVRREFPQRGLSPGTNVSHLLLNTCSSGAPVSFYVINGGGHTWPGAETLEPSVFGGVNLDINAGEEIWAFFAQQSLRGN